MKDFLKAHENIIYGAISCADRIIFKGYNSLSYVDRMLSYLCHNGILIKDFKSHAQSMSHRLRDHALSMARELKRPYLPPEGNFDKEKRAREIAVKDNISDGLIAVMSAVEKSPTFKMITGVGAPRLINASVPHLCLYYYFMNKVYGLIHVRIQTWLPFTVQIYLNGHDWLAHEMDLAGINYTKDDNCFTWISDVEKAQALSDQFLHVKWHDILPDFARLVNPLPEEQSPQDHYWVTDQVEYATDVMFKNPAMLYRLFGKLLYRSIQRFGAEDVLTFLGKKFDGRFTGDQINSMKKRHPGARVKHWVKNNWMKMYNKSGSVLRVETVVNDPKSFKV